MAESTPSDSVPLVHRLRRLRRDRRERPTSAWGALRAGGRRRAFRRAGEAADQYVDHLSPRIALLAVSILVLSSLDAAFTLLHLEAGAREINPIMHLALQGGPTFFVSVKTLGTGVAVVFLALHQNFRVSRVALHCVAVTYLLLLVYHLFLLAA